MAQFDLPKDKWGNNLGEIFRALLTERGVTNYAYVGSTTEGGELPSGLEPCSFWILTPDGKFQSYTIDWDPEKLNPDGEKGYYKLREPWERPVEEGDSLWLKPDYITARKQLNLPLTEEQERILREWEEEQKKYQR